MIINKEYWPDKVERSSIISFLDFLDVEGFIIREGNTYRIKDLTVTVEKGQWDGMIGLVGRIKND